MRNWRVLTAIAAVVLAALAGVLVWKYAENAKNDAKKQYEFESVLVASKRVPANTSFSSALAAGLITREDRVRTDLPATNISGSKTDAQLTSAYKTLVASHDIVAGQTISSEDFVAQGSVQSGLAGQLETDKGKDKTKQLVAVTVTLDDSHAVGGFLQPGDSVNVIMNGDVKDLAGKVTANTTAFLIPDIKVVAVGGTTAAPAVSTQSSNTNSSTPTTVQPQSRSLITFEATPLEAEQIVHGAHNGSLTLVLNPPSFKAGDFKDPGEIVEAQNLYRNPDGTVRPMPTLDQFLRAAAAAQAQK